MTWEMDQKIMQKRYYQQGEKSGEMKKSLEIAKTLLKDGMPVDIIAISLKDVLSNLGAITGEEAGEEIINEIFARFCLGK